MESNDVEDFYDDFLESRMIQYRIYGNPRIEQATERILSYLHSDSRVLDVGCGIGIVPERIAEQLEDGHVWGIDISERNIWYARETISKGETTFFAADILEEKQKVRDRLTEPVDIVTLVDVIEHIPKERHSELFCFFRSITSDQAIVIMTYPSPQYQRHIKKNNPKELQVVDQIIEFDELLEIANPFGFSLQHYSLETVWKRNQYVHCVLQTNDTLSSPHPEPKDFAERITNRVQALWRHHVLYPFRHWKYIEQVFSD
ncbi:class I SAM-dependent methyltransferase [Salinibacter ruber]|uniref:class I SAM-dependent methyltransferase n=1 Tax=Salinibacter ruber TaxID=146919 RepID=UPI0021672859|nr:class I SAM-dependent methyltransferase [Salinibacter ruber]MCS4149347.1 cyclopropane fatty-acyl-phospholipid synthase-like methyltransferase [Salinibacter ruber]